MPFDEIPTELRLQIFSHCDVSTLSSVNRSRKDLRELSRELLYRDIDFGLGRNEFCECEESEDHVWDTNPSPTANFLARQSAFIKTINNSKHGELVKTFRWTLVWPKSVPGESPQSYDELLWKAFDKLKAVRELDLTLARYTPDHRDSTAPTKLFPSAVNIKLGGPMNLALVKAILSNANINTFVLYHVQDKDQDIFETLAYSRSEEFCEKSDHSSCPLYSPIRDGVASWICSSHTRGVFPEIAACLHSLKELYIRRPIVINDDCPHGMDPVEWAEESGPPVIDETTYHEYAALIKRASPTLEILEFEQYQTRQDPNSTGIFGRASLWRLDDHFRRLIWPVLLDGPWPNLQTMRLLGLGPSRSFPCIVSQEQLEGLRISIGDAALDFTEKDPQNGQFFYRTGD